MRRVNRWARRPDADGTECQVAWTGICVRCAACPTAWRARPRPNCRSWSPVSAQLPSGAPPVRCNSFRCGCDPV